VQEAADACGVAYRTLLSVVQRGDLPSEKPDGRPYRLRQADVEAFIERPGEVVTSGCLLSHARVTPARLKALRPDQRTTKVPSTVVATVPVYPPGDERRAAMKGLGIRSPGGRKREGHSERPGGGSPATAGPRRAQGLWQDAGRSAAGPVHWPLWPAPLPPLVGGRGLAHAAEAVPSTAAVAMAPATRRFFMFPPSLGQGPDAASAPTVC
jgi:excisionase family DNA binding protein